MRNLLFSFALLIFTQQVFAEFTIHILSPWRDDTSAARREALRLSGNSEVGYYPGSDMTPEGEGWFVYIYKELSNTGFTMDVVTWIGPERWRGEVKYPFTLSVDSLFAPFPLTVNEIWIIIPDSTKPPLVYDVPPSSKVVNIFNPWPDNSPKIISGKNPPLQMRSRDDICGWYRYYYPGTAEGLTQVKFTDFFRSQIYSASGMIEGPAIDLRSYLLNHDTVYILPRPFPYGEPSITNTFPGRTGECGFRKVSGLFRDWKQDDVSFFNNPTGMSGGGTTGMVLPTLSAPDYKPRINPNGNTRFAEKLETWFETITFPDGTDNDTCMDITLRKGDDGMWTFDSDWMGGFFMLDSFDNPNNVKYQDSKKRMRNFLFTMEMHLQFIYHENAGLEFIFRGDDDVWVYVNNHLVIDLGGLHERLADTLFLDKRKNELGLVDGEMYSLDLFYAERNPVEANFMIKTSMDLRNSDELYYKETILGNGSYQYDIWQRVMTEGISCGTTALLNEEEKAQVNFFLEGPQFPDDSLVPLPPGTHFGGITTDAGKSTVSLDSARISGLAPGEYRIIFQSTVNKERSGYLTFTVYPKPHHLDILTDSIPLDPKKDAFIDSIYISIERDSMQIYAVVRDSAGNFIEPAKSPQWISRNPEIIKVIPDPGNPSRCTILKVDGGTTWVVVSTAGLISDSVRIVADDKPDYPLVSSAVMLDSDGDNIPDLLHITLTDTFKTGQSLSSVEISYRGGPYIIPGASCIIGGNTVLTPFTSSAGIDGRPSGNVKINIDNDGDPESHSGAFTDGVGPSLIAADVLENESSDPDILFLTFSEPIFTSTVKGNQLLLIKAGDDTIPLNILTINNIDNDSTITVLASSSAGKPLAGDLLRLVPGSQGGKISELNGVLPHDLNIPVEIGFRAGAAAIKSSWYSDSDANGIIDRLYLQFKRPVKSQEFDTIRVQWNSLGHLIDPGIIQFVNDSTFYIPVEGTVVRTDQPLTSGFMLAAVEFKAAKGVLRTSIAIDSAAPVLVSAVLRSGRYNLSGEPDDDTLICEFSEDIPAPGNSPFLLANPQTGQYRFNLTPYNSKTTFLVNSIDPSGISPADNDSIWIDISALVKDSSGNIQSNPSNRRVLLQIIEVEPQWMARIGPNPVRPPSPTIIQITPVTPAPVSRFRAQIVIYDALGNRIIDSEMSSMGRLFEYQWNGYNRRGRRVGVGTYMAQVIVKENSKTVYTEKIFVGVKK